MGTPPALLKGHCSFPPRGESFPAAFTFILFLLTYSDVSCLFWCHPVHAASPVKPVANAVFSLRGRPDPRSTSRSPRAHPSSHSDASLVSSPGFAGDPVDRILDENGAPNAQTFTDIRSRKEEVFFKKDIQDNRQTTPTGATTTDSSLFSSFASLKGKGIHSVDRPFQSYISLVQLGGAPVFSGQLGTGVDVMPDSEEDIAVMPNCLFYSSYPGSCIPGSAHSPCRYCRAKQFSGLYGAAQCPPFTSFPPELQSLYRWRITPAKRSRVKGWSDELVCVVEKTAMADHLQMQMQQAGAFRVTPTAPAPTRMTPNPFFNPYARAAAPVTYTVSSTCRVAAAVTMLGLLVGVFCI